MGIVFPQECSVARIERVDDAARARHVHDAIDDEGRRFGTVVDVELRMPRQPELRHVAGVDPVERAEPLFRIRAAGRHPVSGLAIGVRKTLRCNLGGSASHIAGNDCRHPQSDERCRKGCGKRDCLDFHGSCGPVAFGSPCAGKPAQAFIQVRKSTGWTGRRAPSDGWATEPARRHRLSGTTAQSHAAPSWQVVFVAIFGDPTRLRPRDGRV
jgi:hypothetical protein